MLRREKCVKNASKMRGTPLAENTFWTIPIMGSLAKGFLFGKFAEILRKVHMKVTVSPYPMVWPLPRPWSATMVSSPL